MMRWVLLMFLNVASGQSTDPPTFATEPPSALPTEAPTVAPSIGPKIIKVIVYQNGRGLGPFGVQNIRNALNAQIGPGPDFEFFVWDGIVVTNEFALMTNLETGDYDFLLGLNPSQTMPIWSENFDLTIYLEAGLQFAIFDEYANGSDQFPGVGIPFQDALGITRSFFAPMFLQAISSNEKPAIGGPAGDLPTINPDFATPLLANGLIQGTAPNAIFLYQTVLPLAAPVDVIYAPVDFVDKFSLYSTVLVGNAINNLSPTSGLPSDVLAYFTNVLHFIAYERRVVTGAPTSVA